MKYIQSNYNSNHEELNIIPIGDLHIGSPHFDRKTLDTQLDWIDKHRDNTRIILMGDIAETATKDSVGAGIVEQQENAQLQMMKAKGILWDFRDLIDGIVTGNHEQRIYKNSGFDLSLYLAQLLGIDDRYLRYQGIIKYSWNKRAYNVHVFHGAGGGATPGGAMNRLQKQADIVFADVYIAGHTHKRQVHTKTLYVPNMQNNKLAKIKQVFVSTGSALEYDTSYAEEKGLAPSEMGFVRIVLGGRTTKKGESTQRLKEIKVEV